MNTRKKAFLGQLATYFVKKGKILTEAEYRKETDVPIRIILVKRHIGNWARVVKMVQSNFPEVAEVLEAPKVLSPAQKALADLAKKKEEKVVVAAKVVTPKTKEGAKDEVK